MGTKTDSSHKPVGGRTGPANRSSTHWKDSIISMSGFVSGSDVGVRPVTNTIVISSVSRINLLLFMHDYPVIVNGKADYLQPDQLPGVYSIPYYVNFTQDLGLGLGYSGTPIATWDNTAPIGHKESVSGVTSGGVQVDGFLFTGFFPYNTLTHEGGNPEIVLYAEAIGETPCVEGDAPTGYYRLSGTNDTEVVSITETVILKASEYTQAMYDNNNLHESTDFGFPITSKIVGLWEMLEYIP